ncbi:MAG: HlyD family efflux transporter periplasmic adaptor subunit [Deltaproteobacteria bacterium]|nr:HlyD family efflux transporter periplasmic adaptor subunit [Deltaproteobacteria bacterium]
MWVSVLLLHGCAQAEAGPEGSVQGVVEFTEQVVAFESPGRVREVSIHRGDTVSAGQAVAALDSEVASLARQARASELAMAQAQLRLLRSGVRREELRATEHQLEAARANEQTVEGALSRARALVTQGALPSTATEEPEAQRNRARAERMVLEERLRAQRAGARTAELDAAEARVEAATHALQVEDARLARMALRSPLAGTVLDVLVDPGDVVAPGTPVATVADLERPYVDVFVPQARVAGLRVGQPVTVRVDSGPRPLRGSVEDIGRRTEFSPRYLFSPQERFSLVLRVRVRVEDPGHALHAGVPAFVTLRGGAP